MGFLEGLDEEVDVVEVVVEAEGDSNGTGDGECVNQGFGTMMARTHRHALLVKESADVERMDEICDL